MDEIKKEITIPHTLPSHPHNKFTTNKTDKRILINMLLILNLLNVIIFFLFLITVNPILYIIKKKETRGIKIIQKIGKSIYLVIKPEKIRTNPIKSNENRNDRIIAFPIIFAIKSLLLSKKFLETTIGIDTPIKLLEIAIMNLNKEIFAYSAGAKYRVKIGKNNKGKDA